MKHPNQLFYLKCKLFAVGLVKKKCINHKLKKRIEYSKIGWTIIKDIIDNLINIIPATVITAVNIYLN
jgi:hypothetical protein